MFIQGSVSGFDLLHEDRFKSFATVTRSLRLAALNGVDLVKAYSADDCDCIMYFRLFSADRDLPFREWSCGRKFSVR